MCIPPFSPFFSCWWIHVCFLLEKTCQTAKSRCSKTFHFTLAVANTQNKDYIATRAQICNLKPITLDFFFCKSKPYILDVSFPRTSTINIPFSRKKTQQKPLSEMLTYRIARSLKFTMTVLQHMILGAVRLIKMQTSAAKWCLSENKIAQYLQSHTRNHKVNLVWNVNYPDQIC